MLTVLRQPRHQAPEGGPDGAPKGRRLRTKGACRGPWERTGRRSRSRRSLRTAARRLLFRREGLMQPSRYPWPIEPTFGLIAGLGPARGCQLAQVGTGRRPRSQLPSPVTIEARRRPVRRGLEGRRPGPCPRIPPIKSGGRLFEARRALRTQETRQVRAARLAPQDDGARDYRLQQYDTALHRRRCGAPAGMALSRRAGEKRCTGSSA